jgi:3-isopropylmalate dehydrogenase
MLRLSFSLADEARVVERAVEKVLAEGARTPDLLSAGGEPVTTQEMGERIARAVEAA